MPIRASRGPPRPAWIAHGSATVILPLFVHFVSFFWNVRTFPAQATPRRSTPTTTPWALEPLGHDVGGRLVLRAQHRATADVDYIAGCRSGAADHQRLRSRPRAARGDEGDDAAVDMASIIESPCTQRLKSAGRVRVTPKNVGLISSVSSACCSSCAGTPAGIAPKTNWKRWPCTCGPCPPPPAAVDELRNLALAASALRWQRTEYWLAKPNWLPIPARRGRDGVLLLVGADEVEHGLLFLGKHTAHLSSTAQKRKSRSLEATATRAPVLGHSAKFSVSTLARPFATCGQVHPPSQPSHL